VSSTGPKQTIYESLAEVAQALGHPHRLELLEHLAQSVRNVEELAARVHLTFANTSRHLQILRRARLVETERRGKEVVYRLALRGLDQIVDEADVALEPIAERLATCTRIGPDWV